MKKTALVVLAVIILVTASGYAATKPRIAPPPLRVEVIVVQPSPHHVWVAGYWKWAGVNYAWAEGRLTPSSFLTSFCRRSYSRFSAASRSDEGGQFDGK